MAGPLNIVRYADRPVEPWRNGAGRTRTLWVEGKASAPTARISVAELVRDAPFSHLPGLDRTFCLLGPGSVVLEIDGAAHNLLAGEWTTFAGEADVRAYLPEGPARALNIMSMRGQAWHRVEAAGCAIDQAMLAILADGKVGSEFVSSGDLILPPAARDITGRFLAIRIGTQADEPVDLPAQPPTAPATR